MSRVFAPALGVPEDPVTGSTHCMIVPYWCRRLQKHAVTAYQASVRGGILHAEIQKDRVFLSGNAVLYAVSDILPDGMPES